MLAKTGPVSVTEFRPTAAWQLACQHALLSPVVVLDNRLLDVSRRNGEPREYRLQTTAVQWGPTYTKS